MEENMKEVRFDQYCSTCEHKKLPEAEDPCDECLSNPGRQYSHKPLNYKKKEHSNE